MSTSVICLVVIGSLGRCPDTKSVAAEPHPLLAQLSALQHFRIQVDVAVVVVVLTLTNLIAHFTTPWASIVTVPVAAIGLVAWLRVNGLGWAELGLGREHWRSGAAYAAARRRVGDGGDRGRAHCCR